MLLKDKVAVITGAGSGLGRASAILFAKEGAKVVVADIIPEGGEETVRLVREAGGDAVFVRADVSRAADCEKTVKAAVEQFGRLDIIFNNAGISGPSGLVADISEEQWNKTIGIDLNGVFFGTKYAIPEMLKVGGGAIINTSSTAGVRPARFGAAYNSAKAAVIALTKSIALDYAKKNIRANCLLPGAVDTAIFDNIGGGDPQVVAAFRKMAIEKQPMGRFGTAEEVARVALFLASEDASFITGAAIAVDGGMGA